MREIAVSKGMVALVDDSDFDWLSAMKWFASKCGTKHYAVRRENGRNVYMHRLILGGIRVDHRDGDGLNNQRYNLRPASKSQNGQNAAKKRNNTSGFTGVHWHKAAEKWAAEICVDGKRTFLGLFESKEDAAKTYARKAVECFGEFCPQHTVQIALAP